MQRAPPHANRGGNGALQHCTNHLQEWSWAQEIYLACDGFIDGKLKAKITNSDVNLISLRHLQMWVY